MGTHDSAKAPGGAPLPTLKFVCPLVPHIAMITFSATRLRMTLLVGLGSPMSR
jgi:hypothetical protein